MNAQDLRNLSEAYTQLSTKKDDSYLETDMKKRRENNEKAVKDMKKMGTMKNPHFGEEVKGQDTEMRKAAAADRRAGEKRVPEKEGEKNAAFMARKIKMADKLSKAKGHMPGYTYAEGLDPVGKEDGDVNNDGKKDSTDKYLMKRRAAIGKAMGKKNIRGNDSAEQKARLEKKRGMKLDDHPQFKKEDVEEYVDFLIDEGYDCSELTWDEMSEEYASLDEGLRSAVKRIFGGKKKEEAPKPESRGEQLRKKYNVGPEKSDTSAKRQILDRTRAKAERDKKEYGGSRYSKSVADKSAAAHDRYLKSGYSKYGADDARGKGNKARKRAEALKKEEVEAVDEALTGERYKKAIKKGGGRSYSRKVSADPEKRATRGGRGGESDFGAGDRGAGNKAARRAGTYKEEESDYNYVESYLDCLSELYKGKHGQSEKEYMDSRSDAGKQISGDSKQSGAAYSHRSFKGQGKPAKPGERQTAQGRMTQADRDELAIRKANLKKEAFAFSEFDLQELDEFAQVIDQMTDDQLVDFMEDLILEMAEDDQDLIEICEHLEQIEVLSEDRYASAVAASKKNAASPEAKAGRRALRVQRLKSAAGAAAKRVGTAAKAGAKLARKGAVKGAEVAGKAAGHAKNVAGSVKKLGSDMKSAAKSGYASTQKSKPSSSSDSDDDGTDGKLDSVLSSIRKEKPAKKKRPSLLGRAARAVGRGLKKAVGKTARAVSSGSDKLAKRLGEDYDQIAHLYESGKFTITEIENIIESE